MTEKEYHIAVAVEYFGDAIAEIGQHCVDSDKKHNPDKAPNEPATWNREASNDHWGSWGRHISKLGKIDPDSGKLHDVSVLWRMLAINQERAEK